MSSRNVLGVIIEKEFKTRQAFKWSISGGGLTHTVFKKSHEKMSDH